MIFKHTLLPLLAVALQQFAAAVPLDDLGQQGNELELQQLLEQCGTPSLLCPAGFWRGPQCSRRVLICYQSELVSMGLGYCTRCSDGIYRPDRLFTLEEYAEFNAGPADNPTMPDGTPKYGNSTTPGSTPA